MLFGNPEKKRRQEERVARIARFNEKIEDARRDLQSAKERADRADAILKLEIDAHRVMMAPKWEYLLTSTDDIDTSKISLLGTQGWELVGISTYEVGGGMSQTFKVKMMYAFKRPIPEPPGEATVKHAAQLAEIGPQIKKLEDTIRQLERERDGLPVE